MKNPKEKNSPRKALKDKIVLKNNNNNILNSGPGEEEIREKAEEIYYQRLERGENGTSTDDWLAAEEYLRELEGK